jgi:hypothetical protein
VWTALLWAVRSASVLVAEKAVRMAGRTASDSAETMAVPMAAQKVLQKAVELAGTTDQS